MSDPFQVLGVDHVTITTPEEFAGDVFAWYRDILGLQQVDKPEGTRESGTWFGIGNQQIHISVDEHNPPQKAHFGIVVGDFEAAVQRLRDAGCHIEQASTIPGRRRFYTRDPAGNRLEVVHFEEDATSVVAEEST